MSKATDFAHMLADAADDGIINHDEQPLVREAAYAAAAALVGLASKCDQTSPIRVFQGAGQ